MSIRTRIYLAIGLLGAICVLIGGMAFFVLNQYDAKLAAYRNASDRAFLGEHLNRQVSSVVMEARGIYAAADTEKAKKFADGLLEQLKGIDETLVEWRPLVPEDQLPAFEAVVARSAEFHKFRAETARLGTQVSIAAANEQGNNDANRANRKAFQAEIDTVVKADRANLDTIEAEIGGFRTTMMATVLFTVLAGLAIGGAAAFRIASAQISRPILSLTATMTRLAEGDLSVEVPYEGRADEIGQISNAVSVFRRNAIQMREINQGEKANQHLTQRFQADAAAVVASATAGDLDRRLAEDYQTDDLNGAARLMNSLLDNIDSVLDEVSNVVANVAQGDLTASMRGQYQGAFANLQHNLNTALHQLRQSMQQVRGSTDEINRYSGELRHASENLARRTEQQAAALEETSAALEEITSAVRSSAQRAEQVTRTVGEANASARQSASVVRDAIDAMGRIESASSEITQIINVIDEIAFQTNLLALNAGVEAARAGEAGKGFAVVAQEVRELAQRAAHAAKDIKGLITKSGQEVTMGVKFVQATGASLSEIESRVLKINDDIHAIATASKEQSVGLQEVSTAINQMDQMTQQNAAMVEETAAVTEKLDEGSIGLAENVGRFNLGQENVTRSRYAA